MPMKPVPILPSVNSTDLRKYRLAASRCSSGIRSHRKASAYDVWSLYPSRPDGVTNSSAKARFTSAARASIAARTFSSPTTAAAFAASVQEM